MKKIVSLLLATMTMICAVSMLSGCQNEEPPMNWWEDRENLTYIIEDLRAEPKNYTCKGNEIWPILNFEYVYNEEDTEEYIPKLKVMYKGEEKEIYLHYYRKQQYSNSDNTLGHTGTIDRKGRFYVCWYMFQNKEAHIASSFDRFESASIYITVK